MSVTVVSCMYAGFKRFFSEWTTAVYALDPAPDDVRVASYGNPTWLHRQAALLQEVVYHAETDWVVIADIDDTLYPDALAGLEDVAADVWQMGYDDYIVPQLSAEEYLALDGNPFTGSSAIRTESFRQVGGFQDIAFQDWGLWRRMARAGMTFQSSGRAHFHYNRHDATRGALELTPEARATHMAEMMEAELATV